MRSARLLALALLVSVAGAASADVAGKPAARPAAKAKAPRAAEWKPVVPFIEDDFGRALALAKERKRPLFIEGWAPW